MFIQVLVYIVYYKLFVLFILHINNVFYVYNNNEIISRCQIFNINNLLTQIKLN